VSSFLTAHQHIMVDSKRTST